MREDVHKRLAARNDNAPLGSPECLVRHEQHRTLSLVLPTRPETATVGHIVAALRAGPLDCVPLIAGLVLIGFRSTDGTAAPAGSGSGCSVRARSSPHTATSPVTKPSPTRCPGGACCPHSSDHGRTGFLAAADGFMGSLSRSDGLGPPACREAAEQWTPAGMARQHLDLHTRLKENPS